jgi:Ca2+-binding EF-hand superfamily protein
MVVPLFLVALASGAAQPAVRPQAPRRGVFISPMGEPFYGSAPGEDGLIVWFRQTDADHDGRITLAELKQEGRRFFLALDINHDGEIDPDEIERYETVVAPEIRVSGFGGYGDDEASGAGRLGLLAMPEPVRAADTDFNGGISAYEFDAAASARFQLIDSNHDGSLELPEVTAMREAVRSNARKPYHDKKEQDAPAPPPDDSDPDAGG